MGTGGAGLVLHVQVWERENRGCGIDDTEARAGYWDGSLGQRGNTRRCSLAPRINDSVTLGGGVCLHSLTPIRASVCHGVGDIGCCVGVGATCIVYGGASKTTSTWSASSVL